jgi:hypothetical protein
MINGASNISYKQKESLENNINSVKDLLKDLGDSAANVIIANLTFARALEINSLHVRVFSNSL